MGAVGLILLTIFDNYHHNRMHNICLGVFIIGYIVSAIFICWEYQRLGIHYRQHSILRISFWVKLAFIIAGKSYPSSKRPQHLTTCQKSASASSSV